MSLQPRHLSRRLLLGLSLGSALLLLGRTGRGLRDLGDTPTSIERFVQEQRARLAAAAAIGVAYLNLHPAEHHRAWLVAALERRIARVADPTGESSDVGNALRRAVREDFKCGDTVRVRRWLLSRTEARLFALGSLHHGG